MINLKNTIEVTKKSRTILSLDPSSTRTGCAVMGFDGVLFDMFALVPDAKDTAADRIFSQCVDLYTALEQGVFNPDIIVIESTSGKVGRRHRGGGAGLGVYGMAVGAIWMTCRGWVRYCRPDRRVILVPENDWTEGKTKKQRAFNAALLYPKYKPEGDPGLDIGDAIGLARWFVDREK